MSSTNYPKVLMRGAESVITQIDDHTITKYRPKKSYRVSEIDLKFTLHRTRSEGKLLKKLADANVAVPKVYEIDEETHTLVLEYINGTQIKEILTKNNADEFGKKIGLLLSQIHNQSVIHADFTTSNMLSVNDTIYVVDFGLGYISIKPEDKAVDLHLLNQALQSYHAPIAETVMSAVIQMYKKEAEDSERILERFETVEKRGRNKH